MAYTYSMKRKSETPSKLDDFLEQLRMDGYAPPSEIRTDMGSEYYVSPANTPAGEETRLSQFSTICKRHRIRHRVAPPNKSLHNDIEFVINLVGFADTLAPTNDDDNDFVDTGLHNHTTAGTLAATTGHFSSSSHQQEVPSLTTADTLAATATSTRRKTTPPKTPPRKQVRFAPSAKKTSAASAAPNMHDAYGAPHNYKVAQRTSTSTSATRQRWLSSTAMESHPAKRVLTRTTWLPWRTLPTPCKQHVYTVLSRRRQYNDTTNKSSEN